MIEWINQVFCMCCAIIGINSYAIRVVGVIDGAAAGNGDGSEAILVIVGISSQGFAGVGVLDK